MSNQIYQVGWDFLKRSSRFFKGCNRRPAVNCSGLVVTQVHHCILGVLPHAPGSRFLSTYGCYVLPSLDLVKCLALQLRKNGRHQPKYLPNIGQLQRCCKNPHLYRKISGFPGFDLGCASLKSAFLMVRYSLDSYFWWWNPFLSSLITSPDLNVKVRGGTQMRTMLGHLRLILWWFNQQKWGLTTNKWGKVGTTQVYIRITLW